MPLKKSISIALNKNERKKLESTVRKAKSPQRDVLRAKIILLAAEGKGNGEIAKELKCQRFTVRRWRKRFFKKRLKGLQDQVRSGRPLFFPLGSLTQGRGAGHLSARRCKTSDQSMDHQ